jgi:hypothetical protein
VITNTNATWDKIRGASWFAWVLVLSFLTGLLLGLIFFAYVSRTSKAIVTQATICSVCDDQQACVAEWWSSVDVIERCVKKESVKP